MLSFLHFISIVLSFLQMPVLTFGKDRLGAHCIVLHPFFNSFFCLFLFFCQHRNSLHDKTISIIVNYVSISSCVQYV